MSSRAGVFDFEFNKKSINDPEVNSKGLLDPDLSTTPGAVVSVPFASVASAMAVVLSIGYAVDTDARLAKPNAQRVQVAPLTLTYGDQPPKSSFVSIPKFEAIQAPREDWGAQSAPKSLAWQAAVTFTPKPSFPYGLITTSWQPDDSRLLNPNDKQQKIAPLALVYGDQPPQEDALSVVDLLALQSWPKEKWPTQRAAVSLAWLARGDQPPQEDALSVVDLIALQSWPKDEWASQRAVVSTAWAVLPSWSPYVPFPYNTILTHWPTSLEPQPDRRLLSLARIAPLTLTYGDRPPQEVITVQAWPREDWGAQTAPRSLAWFTPPLDVVPPNTPYPIDFILASWPVDLEPRLGKPNDQRVRIAPLTLIYGDQPAQEDPLSIVDLLTIQSWPKEEWASQRGPVSYAWFVPPTWSPFVSFPYGLILANWPADLEPRPAQSNIVRPKTVTLTFARVDQPPTQAGLTLVGFTIVALNQTPVNGPQAAPPNAAWNTPIFGPVTYRPLKDNLDLLVRAWPLDLEPVLPAALVRRPQTVTLTLVYGQQPPVIAPLSLTNRITIDAWPLDLTPQPPFSLLMRPQTVTLTLPTGQMPPRKTLERMMQALLASWPLDLEPRLGNPNDARVHLASLLAHKLSIISARGSYVILINAQGSLNFEDDI